jgi:hypothetical protein
MRRHFSTTAPCMPLLSSSSIKRRGPLCRTLRILVQSGYKIGMYCVKPRFTARFGRNLCPAVQVHVSGRHPVFNVPENAPDFAGRLDGRRKLLVDWVVFQLTLVRAGTSSANFGSAPSEFSCGTSSKGRGHAQSRIGPVIRNAPARIEQTLAFQVHKCPAEHRVVAAVMTEHFSSAPRTQRSTGAASRARSYLCMGLFSRFLSRSCRAPPKGRHGGSGTRDR